MVKGVLLKWPVGQTKFEKLKLTLGVQYEFKSQT